MQTREIIGLTLIPIALLITSGTLNYAGVGSAAWFCGLIASGILLLTLIGFSYNRSPTGIPDRTCWIVFIASVSILGVGMIIRIIFHEEILRQQFSTGFGLRQPRETNWAFVIVTELYQWLSFSGVLFCVFFAHRLFGIGPSQAISPVAQQTSGTSTGNPCP